MGATKNGGIGTFCYELAFLLKDEHDITVLFTAPITDATKIKALMERYRGLGIRVIYLDENPPSYQRFGAEWFIGRSLKVLEFFQHEPPFDIIHFQDYEANGFIPIQSKKSGMAFADTLLTVTMHSNSQWLREAQQHLSSNPALDVKLGYCEQYCCENADAILSPSQHMLDWVKENGWKLPQPCRVLPYPIVAQPRLTQPAPLDFSHLVFFGRLEARKGLELFCQSILAVMDHQNHGIKTISFLGRPGFLSSGEISNNYLNEFTQQLKNAGIQVMIKSDLDSFEANHYISNSGGIVFIPSLIDNYPYAILECIHNSFPVFASRSGGIPEMLSDNSLFEVNKDSLTQTILERKTRLNKITTRYDSSTACRQWQDFHKHDLISEPSPTEGLSSATVSICVTHYNHGKYLPDLLKSIANNDDQPDEVIIIDDHSTCEDSKRIFLEEESKYLHWTFIAQKMNEGANASRNECAKRAKGKYLLFMDSDNLASPSMIQCFKKAIVHSAADVATCHYAAFDDGQIPSSEVKPLFTYHPVGAALESGLLENVFGDANFIIKKAVFEKTGGFNPDKNLACSDWEILARLCLEGYKLQVIPYSLFYYRYLPQSWLRTSNNYYNENAILKTYQKYWMKLNSKTMLTDFVASQNAVIRRLKGIDRRRGKTATLFRTMERKVRKARKGIFAHFSRNNGVKN